MRCETQPNGRVVGSKLSSRFETEETLASPPEMELAVCDWNSGKGSRLEIRDMGAVTLGCE